MVFLLKKWLGSAVKGHMSRTIDYAFTLGVPRDFSRPLLSEVTMLSKIVKDMGRQIPRFREMDAFKQYGLALEVVYEQHLSEHGEGEKALRERNNEQITTESQFVDNKNGTVTDTKTGLMWQQGDVSIKTWQEAFDYCNSLSLAGYSDWRLPERNELESIMDLNYDDPCINTNIFTDAVPSSYWSSTVHADYSDSAWFVRFAGYRGYSEYIDKSSYCFVRAVRGAII